MSTLTISNLSDGTKTIPTTNLTNGSAKAWVSFDGTGTLSVRDSYATSSVTDNNTGDYTLNLSNAMSDGNYTMTAAGGGISGSFNTSISVANYLAQPTASALRVVSYYGTNNYDCSHANAAVLGDLA